MMDNNHKPYSKEEESDNPCCADESAAALVEEETLVMPDQVDYANIVGGILQVTPDIEEEIAAVDRGETVQMDEFKKMFAKWLA